MNLWAVVREYVHGDGVPDRPAVLFVSDDVGACERRVRDAVTADIVAGGSPENAAGGFRKGYGIVTSNGGVTRWRVVDVPAFDIRLSRGR